MVAGKPPYPSATEQFTFARHITKKGPYNIHMEFPLLSVLERDSREQGVFHASVMSCTFGVKDAELTRYDHFLLPPQSIFRNGL